MNLNPPAVPGLELSRAVFEQNLNTDFQLKAENGEREALSLVQIQTGYCTPRNEQFSLIFRGDKSKVYPQRTYAVEHDLIGSFDLFLVPIARNQEGTLYEAVFNRFVAAPEPA